MKLFSELHNLGWNIVDPINNLESNISNPQYLFYIRKKDLTIGISLSDIHKLVFEMYSLESIVKIFDSHFNSNDKTNKKIIYRFINEDELWR